MRRRKVETINACRPIEGMAVPREKEEYVSRAMDNIAPYLEQAVAAV